MTTIIENDEGAIGRSAIRRNELSIRPAATELIAQPYVIDADGSAEPTSNINPTTILHSLRRTWLLGAILGILLAGPLGVGAWLVFRPEYKATGVIRITAEHVPLLFETADHAVNTNYRNFKNTQRQLILDANLLNSALKREEVSELAAVKEQADPIGWLQKRLIVHFPDDAELMHVSFTHSDAKVAKSVVDAVMNTYNDDVVKAERDERMNRIDSLERAKVDAEIKARTRRAELRGLAETLGSGDSTTLHLAQQAALQQFGLIRSELTKVQFEVMRREGELQVHSQFIEPDASESDGGEAPTGANQENADQPSGGVGGSDSEMAGEDASEVKLEGNPILMEDELGARYLYDFEKQAKLIERTEKRLAPAAAAPYIAKYREKMEEARRLAEERLIELQAGGYGRAGDLKSRNANGLSEQNIPLEIAILKTQEKKLLEELKDQEAEGKKIGRSSIDVEMMTKEVDGLDKVVSSITDELERTRIELKSNSRITMFGDAQVPPVGTSKKRLPLAGAAALFGLLAPLGALLIFDIRRQLVNGRQTMSEQLKLPVLGSLPHVPRRVMAGLSTRQDGTALLWRRRLNESVSAMTSLLLHKLDLEGHRVVLISSAVQGEGKSTLAMQLALSLADSGHRTLLLDFDLRRPTLHQRFKVLTDIGIAEVLSDTAELEEAMVEITPRKLYMLTAGHAQVSLLQAASNGSMKALFANARANFEFVIVDSCPLLPVMDGRLVGRQTDAAILSVIKDKSTIPNLMAARSILDEFGIPVLGCVVTGDASEDHYSPYEKDYRYRAQHS